MKAVYWYIWLSIKDGAREVLCNLWALLLCGVFCEQSGVASFSFLRCTINSWGELFTLVSFRAHNLPKSLFITPFIISSTPSLCHSSRRQTNGEFSLYTYTNTISSTLCRFHQSNIFFLSIVNLYTLTSPHLFISISLPNLLSLPGYPTSPVKLRSILKSL